MDSPRFAVGVPEDHRRATVLGVDIAYTDTGHGLPVVCLHATGHGARDFAHLPQLCGDPIRVVALDWPGHGRSADDSAPASAERYAELLEAFIERLSLGRVVLLGNSIGGAAAILYTAKHPDKVCGLVLATSGGLVEVNGFVRFVCNRVADFFRAGVKKRRWFGPAFALYYRMILNKGDIREHRRRIVAAGYDHAPVLEQAWRSFARPDADLRHLLPTIKCNTFVVWAKGDRILAYRACKPAIDTIPNAETVLFKGGHSAFLEDPETFREHFTRFIRGCSRQTSAHADLEVPLASG